jgi:hypothetical protein
VEEAGRAIDSVAMDKSYTSDLPEKVARFRVSLITSGSERQALTVLDPFLPFQPFQPLPQLHPYNLFYQSQLYLPSRRSLRRSVLRFHSCIRPLELAPVQSRLPYPVLPIHPSFRAGHRGAGDGFDIALLDRQLPAGRKAFFAAAYDVEMGVSKEGGRVYWCIISVS